MVRKLGSLNTNHVTETQVGRPAAPSKLNVKFSYDFSSFSFSGTGGMRDSLEGTGSAQNDLIHLQRRVGLFSGVALIVGTMIGKYDASGFI